MKFGVPRLKTFFLCNSSEWIANIGVIMKSTNKSITGKKIQKNWEGCIFYFLVWSWRTFKFVGPISPLRRNPVYRFNTVSLESVSCLSGIKVKSSQVKSVKLEEIQIKFFQKFFNRVRNPVVEKKNFGSLVLVSIKSDLLTPRNECFEFHLPFKTEKKIRC